MQSQLTTLKNGLRIITSNFPQLESVSLGLWVQTGSAYEKEEDNGISHFLEHMSFKGTKKRTALQISEEIEDVGGQSNAYTAREFTAYYAKMLKNDMALAADVLTDSLFNFSVHGQSPLHLFRNKVLDFIILLCYSIFAPI